MKNLKKLSVVFMLTALFSTSFTSCIDNEVDPIVETIYAAQADLIAAQAAVQNAEAALRLARAAAAQAQADLTIAQAAQVDAITAGIEADNAFKALKREQEIMRIVAETTLAVAQAEMDLAVAQAEFEIQMAELMEELEQMGVLLAIDYAREYGKAMRKANEILREKMDKEEKLALAQLMQKGDVSWAYYIAGLEAAVAAANAKPAMLEGQIADLEAYLADPSNPEAQYQMYKDQYFALKAMQEAKKVELTEKWNEIMAVYDENDMRDDFVFRYEEAMGDLEDAKGDKKDREDWIETAEGKIEGYEDAIADYAGLLSDYEDAVDAAEDAIDDAFAILGMQETYDSKFNKDADGANAAAGGTKYNPAANLQEERVNAKIDYKDAQAASDAADQAVIDFQAELDNLTQAYNDAADALADEIAALVGNTYQADFDAAETAAANALLAAGTAKGVYDLKKLQFENDPTGTAWYAGPNGYLGDHTDDPAQTRIYVVSDESPGENVVDFTTVSVGDAPLTGVWRSLANIIDAGDNGIAQPGDYFNVENDDVSFSHLYEFNVATNELGLEDFTDRPLTDDGEPKNPGNNWMDPLDPDTDMHAGYDMTPDADGKDDGGPKALTAWAALWNAQLAEAKAAYDLAHMNDALNAAQDEYDHQKDLYENGLATLAGLEQDAIDAQAAEDLAQGELDDANQAVEDAWAEIGPVVAGGPYNPAGTLREALRNAEIDLADHKSCDVACYEGKIEVEEGKIETWTAEIAEIQPIIDAKQAIVDEMMEQCEECFNNDGFYSSLPEDLHAQIILLWQEFWNLENEWWAYEDEMNLLLNFKNVFEDQDVDDQLASLTQDLADLKDELAGCAQVIEEAEQALAKAQVEQDAAAAMIAFYEARVAALTARYENWLAIAAKYKALMDAAIAS